MSEIVKVKYKILILLLGSAIVLTAQLKPNVILIMTDDQGYGDIGAHGNVDIVTPNLDKLHSESVRLTNFHVNTLCAPTRAALMTGKYALRVGVWATIFGRSMLAGEHVTMAEVFKASGYATGMFGKWHLGDNWPMYPHHQGFDEVLTFGGGTISNIADYWKNDLFDDHYLHNGKWEPYEGYCTDIWFGEATKWIKANKDKPFFAYIPTNAPHSPFRVWQEYIDMYNGTPVEHKEFYGMITRLDEKLGELREFLKTEGLDSNTIFIFMTDNGTVAGQGHGGWNYYNAGMRGAKGSMYDGGHRVPFFIRWPAGNLQHGKDINTLAAQVDLIPTFISMCDLTPPAGVTFDGTDISPLFTGAPANLDNRILIVPRQGSQHVPTYNMAAVMKGNWRMIRNSELYDIGTDPGQQTNVFSQHPDLVAEMKAVYDEFWESTKAQREGFTYIPLGSDEENPSILTGHDWQPDKTAAWQSQARGNKKGANGWFTVYFIQDGRYNFGLRKFPAYLSDAEASPIMSDVSQVRFTLKSEKGPYDLDTTFNVSGTFPQVDIELDLKRDSMRLQSWLDIEQNQGSFYVYVTRLTPNTSVKGKSVRYDISMDEVIARMKNRGKNETLRVYNGAGTLLCNSEKQDWRAFLANSGATIKFIQFSSNNEIQTFKFINN